MVVVQQTGRGVKREGQELQQEHQQNHKAGGKQHNAGAVGAATTQGTDYKCVHSAKGRRTVWQMKEAKS
jgi:hypothetical protein